MSLQWMPIGPWPVVLLTIAGLYALVLLTYPPRIRHLSLFRQRLLITLRLLAATVLAVAMLRPSIVWPLGDPEPQQIVLLRDRSHSMTIADGTAGKTRQQMVTELLELSSPELEAINDQVEIKTLDFAATVQDSLSAETADPLNAETTELGLALKTALENTGGKKTLAVFAFTDGTQRTVNPQAENPVQVARQYGAQGTSLFSIPIGGTTNSDAGTDVAIEDFDVPQVVFLNKSVPVSVQVRWAGTGGQPVELGLLLETQAADGSRVMRPAPVSRGELSRTVIETTARPGEKTVTLSFSPNQPGEWKLAVVAKPQEGEVQLTNNQRESIVQVRKGGVRIAYFDLLRNEVKYLRSLNQSSKIQIDYFLMRTDPRFQNRQLQPEMFSPGAYDVYIIGDVPASVMGNENLELLVRQMDQGAGLLMLGGYHTYSAGGYASSPLARRLPVQLNAALQRPVGQFDASQHLQTPITVLPTASGNRHFVTLVDDPVENAKTWSSLIALEGANRLAPKSEFVEVLATSQEQAPLMIAGESGRSRIMCLAMDDTYAWAQAGRWDIYQRFWRQLMMWLAHQELETDQPVWLRMTPRAIDPGAPIMVEYGALNDQGQEIAEANFTLQLTTPEGETRTLMTAQSPQDRTFRLEGLKQAGDYQLRLDATVGDSAIGLPALSRLIVNDRDLERDNPVVDLNTLREATRMAATTTDSQVIAPEDLQSFLKEYLEREPWNAEEYATETIRFWDGWPILLLYVGLLTAEWWARKTANLV